MPYIVLLISFLAFIQPNEQDPEPISGRLFDKEGNGIPGVQVKIKGTNIGAITDSEGNFLLTIPENMERYSLIFSQMGYSSEELTFKQKSKVNLLFDEKGIHKIYWQCTSHSPVHSESEKGKLKETHDSEEIFKAVIK